MGQAKRRQEEIARLKEFSVISTQELMERLKQSSTVNWVDEGYADKLAQQLYNRIKSEAGGAVVSTLGRIRQSAGYLSETEEDGITKVWFLDYSKSSPGCGYISPLFYGKDGKWDNALTAKENITITAHALGRCYQRLRTNSSSDLKALLLKLVGLADAEEHLGCEVEVTVPGGRFYMVQDNIPVSWHEVLKKQRKVCEEALVANGESLDDPDVQQAIEEFLSEQEVPVKVTIAGTGETREGKAPLKQVRAMKVGNPGWVVKTFIADKV